MLSLARVFDESKYPGTLPHIEFPGLKLQRLQKAVDL